MTKRKKGQAKPKEKRTGKTMTKKKKGQAKQWPKEKRTGKAMAKRKKDRQNNGQKKKGQTTQWPKQKGQKNKQRSVSRKVDKTNIWS
jgi:hypothetical protein